MASVKWLTGVHAVREKFEGYWQTSDYAYWQSSDGIPVRVPLAEMSVKSQIARPSTYDVIPAGQPYTIVGACWCGDAEVNEVEISTDGGASWAFAEFLDTAQRFSWQTFPIYLARSRAARHLSIDLARQRFERASAARAT